MNFFSRRKSLEEQVTEVPPKEAEINKIDQEPATTPSPMLHMHLWVRERGLETIKKDFQMTIQSKVTNLSTKEASMLLMVCNVLALREGLDITTYLAMEFLYARLTRSGSIQPEEIKEEKQRQTALLAHLILSTFRGEWTDLGEKIYILDDQVYAAIRASNWLPDKRTFNSWLQHWLPEKWLELRIVPLEVILDRSRYSEPYSGYCKGYGEGSSRGAQSTPYDSELDGEEYSEPTPPRFNLLEAKSYQEIHNAIEANRARKVQTK